MKGKTLTTILDQRSIEHLDPTSDTHRLDQEEYRRARQERIPQNWMEEACESYLISEKFRSLENGIMFDASGEEIDSSAFNEIIQITARERDYYWGTEKKRGKVISRKVRGPKNDRVKTLHQIAITFRPDHSLALHILDREAQDEESLFMLRKFIKFSLRQCIKHYAENSNYDVIAATVHPNEGCLHFHLIFSTVSQDNELLHESTLNPNGKRGIGNPRLRHAGPCQVGSERMRRTGIPIDDDINHLKQLRSKIRKCGLPVDLKVSEVLDGCVVLYQMKYKHTKPLFDHCFDLWAKAKTGTWKSQPKPGKSVMERIRDEKLVVAGIEI